MYIHTYSVADMKQNVVQSTYVYIPTVSCNSISFYNSPRITVNIRPWNLTIYGNNLIDSKEYFHAWNITECRFTNSDHVQIWSNLVSCDFDDDRIRKGRKDLTKRNGEQKIMLHLHIEMTDVSIMYGKGMSSAAIFRCQRQLHNIYIYIRVN